MNDCTSATFAKFNGSPWRKDGSNTVTFSATTPFIRTGNGPYAAPGQTDPTTVTSQMENCGIIMQDGKESEIVMSFDNTVGGSDRFCFKAYINNYAMFYVESPPLVKSTSFTREHCADLLTSATNYKVMLRDTAAIDGPFAGVDMTAIIKAGTYRAEYRIGDPAQAAYSCSTSVLGISSVTVTVNTMYLNPCLSGGATYQIPFRKNLYIAGFVRDDVLDTVQLPDEADGGFIAVTYYDGATRNHYYIMRFSEASFLNELTPTYLTLTFMTDSTNSYNQTGYVDSKYIVPAMRSNLMTVKAKTMLCESDKPCLSGGLCIDKWQNFTCNCTAGYSGPTCAERDDTCTRQTNQELCSNRGTCVDTANGYTCNCDVGFDGTKCERTTACRADTCQNGGTCYDPVYDGTDTTFCDCPPLYTGDNCEFRKTCKSLPCKNNAVCYDNTLTGDYFCQCATGFTGKNCDNAGTGTGPNPIICVSTNDGICQNGGICVDNKCQCKDFYVGKFCQEMNNWFIGSIVLIVLLAVIFIVTLIVCCFFCARDRTLGGPTAEKGPYDPFDNSYTGTSSAPGGVYAQSNQGYTPTGFTVTQSAPSESPFYPISF